MHINTYKEQNDYIQMTRGIVHIGLFKKGRCVTQLCMEESYAFCTSVILKDCQIVQPMGVVSLHSPGLLR